jgi:uncharacterized membrane protein YhhN
LAPVALGLFVVVSTARLVAIPLELDDLARGSTVLLMPSLALWVLARRGPILLVAALLCSAAGDILLGIDGLFLAGMGAFAAAHVCYVTLFVRSGALPALRRRWFLLVPYVVAVVALALWLWSDLGDLRIPVVAYAVLLTATAVTAGALGWRLGLGGALFFVSDTMIAVWDIAGRPAPPLPGLWIMSTYILAQYLLASGALRAGQRGVGGESA